MDILYGDFQRSEVCGGTVKKCEKYTNLSCGFYMHGVFTGKQHS